MLSVAAMPRDGIDHPVTILHRGARYCVRFLRSTAQRAAVVYFEYWLPHPTLEGEASAEAFFRHRGLNAVLVLAAENDWFQHAEMAEALAAIRGVTAGFDLVGHGGSMGGHAALAFSESLGLRRVVAVCPQYSIDAARAPYEQRWREEAARIAAEGGFRHDGIDRVRRLTEGWLIYDPGCVDGRHAADIQAHHGLGELRLRFGGHHHMLMLQQVGLYAPMLLDMLAGRFDQPAFIRSWRRARRGSAAFWLGLSYALRLRGNHPGALRAALQARPLPHPEPAAVDMIEACAQIGVGNAAAVRRLATPWAQDPAWGPSARWCLSQVPPEPRPPPALERQ